MEDNKASYKNRKIVNKKVKQCIYDVEMVGDVKQDDDSLRGAGIMDWLKHKYNAFVQPQPQAQPQPQVSQQTNIIQPANQPLPPEIPSTKILHLVASNAYKRDNGQPVDGFQIIDSTATLKLYKSLTKASFYILGVRGTEMSDEMDKDADLSFNAGIVGNNLKKSKRYILDKQTIINFLSKHNIQDSDFIVGAAHSLGGALCDELLHDGLIDYAVSFNPAVQPKDVGFTQFHRRIYLDKDPLYQSMARNNVKNNIEVRATPETSGSKLLGSLNSTLGNIWKTKNAHSIDNFVGGQKLFDEVKNVWVSSPDSKKQISPTQQHFSENQFDSKVYDEGKNMWLQGGVKYFVYKADNDVNFAGKMMTEQCQKIINNRRCKRRCMMG